MFRTSHVRGLVLVILMVFPAGSQSVPISISTVREPQRIAANSVYPFSHYPVLTQHIKASDPATCSDGAGFHPTGHHDTPFPGSFRGGRHTIMGLQIKRPERDAVGMLDRLHRAAPDDTMSACVEFFAGHSGGGSSGLCRRTNPHGLPCDRRCFQGFRCSGPGRPRGKAALQT